MAVLGQKNKITCDELHHDFMLYFKWDSHPMSSPRWADCQIFLHFKKIQSVEFNDSALINVPEYYRPFAKIDYSGLGRLRFAGGFVEKNLPTHSKDLGWIPGLGRSPEGGNGNPLQYSCLENPMDRGGWRATVYGITKVGHDWVTERGMVLVCSFWQILAKSFKHFLTSISKSLGSFQAGF